MDLVIEANRNSALFNTMQQALDVYNPLLHKARPTIVNQTKHRIPCNPTRWGNTLDTWNGAQSVRFDLPRIGSLVDFTLKCAFRIPGTSATAVQKLSTGDRGFAKTSLTTGGLVNVDHATSYTARGRLDRLYADRLLGFNMIRGYTVSSKSRRIFSATGEYLLCRFSQMDEDMKKSVMDSITPVDPLASDCDKNFYAPATTYTMNIPLFMFFNEHITSALDVNFSEEVHIDIELRPPSELFYYGQLGDLSQAPLFFAAAGAVQVYPSGTRAVTWDNAVLDSSVLSISSLTSVGSVATATTAAAHGLSSGSIVTIDNVTPETGYNITAAITVTSPTTFTYTGTFSASPAGGTITYDTNNGMAGLAITTLDQIASMKDFAKRHIQGVGAPFDKWGAAYGAFQTATSGPTFAFPDVDNNGESVQVQFQANADYIVQDTDAYRALRAQMFPEGTGLTTIVYNTAQERFQNLMAYETLSQNILDGRSAEGGFTDPAYSATGLTLGDSSRYVDLPIRNNNLAFATHFMVRKHSDMGGDGNCTAGSGPTTQCGTASSTNTLGAHRIYTRCLPVHYFQVLAAGRVVYESDADSHLNLTQSGMYNGTGLEWGAKGSSSESRMSGTVDNTRSSGRPFNVYSINWGLQASRLENSGSLSFQNLNNPVLRVYFKPDTWSEYSVDNNLTTLKSDALVAATSGVQVDVIHEYFNVITINSGNGEITSGLNQ